MTRLSQTLLRFTLSNSHPDTGVSTGIFQAAYDLQRGNDISIADRQVLEELLAWFEANLTVLQRFNRTKSKGYYRRRAAGISWLKPTATEHLAKFRELAAILQENGLEVCQIATERPGYVIYEDDYQLIAEPFRGGQG